MGKFPKEDWSKKPGTNGFGMLNQFASSLITPHHMPSLINRDE